MASEASIRGGLQITKGNLKFRGSVAFNADVSGTKGPTPGAIDVSVSGTDVDLSQLGTPGFCQLENLSALYYVEVGIWDPDGARFYPLMELLPGEGFVIRLARDLQEEYGTGTGTLGLDTNRLRLKARGGVAVVVVQAFEK